LTVFPVLLQWVIMKELLENGFTERAGFSIKKGTAGQLKAFPAKESFLLSGCLVNAPSRRRGNAPTLKSWSNKKSPSFAEMFAFNLGLHFYSSVFNVSLGPIPSVIAKFLYRSLKGLSLSRRPYVKGTFEEGLLSIVLGLGNPGTPATRPLRVMEGSQRVMTFCDGGLADANGYVPSPSKIDPG